MPEKKHRLPSKGYLRIFNRVCIEGRTPEQVAAELNIKVETVNDVVWKVRKFMRQHGAKIVMENPALQQVALAREVYMARLEYLWSQSADAWHHSQRPVETTKVGKTKKSDGKEEERSERTQVVRSGDARFLVQARYYLAELLKQCGPPTSEEQGAEYVQRLTLTERLEKVDHLLAAHGHTDATPRDGSAAAEPAPCARAA